MNSRSKIRCWFLICTSAFVLMASSTLKASWDDLSRGFTVLPSSEDSLCTEDFFQSVRNLKSMGANTVSIRVAYSLQNATASIIYPYSRTVSDEALTCSINFIQSQGMEFGLGMVINGPEWRALFEPEDRDGWFEDMGELAARYARDFAEPYGASYFSLGTEMYSLVSNEHNSENAAAAGRYRWPEIVADVREGYSGIVTYSAQHSGDRSAVFEDNDLMAHLDVLGFSGYWPLYADNKVDLLNEWARIESEIILPAYNRYGKPIELAEVGYRPCDFTFERPYDADTECTYDGAAQSLAWDALLTFFESKTYFVGLVGGWLWLDSPYIGGEGDTDFTPWGKPAADTIASFWPRIPDTEETQVPFGESQLSGVPYCDPSDTNVPATGWGNMSNYSINGITLASNGCIFQGGPADNEFGVAPVGTDALEGDDSDIEDTAGGPVSSDDTESGDVPGGTDTSGDTESPSTPTTDDSSTIANDDSRATVEGSRIFSGSLSVWFLMIVLPFVRRKRLIQR